LCPTGSSRAGACGPAESPKVEFAMLFLLFVVDVNILETKTQKLGFQHFLYLR
jgi:hypothetical protein